MLSQFESVYFQELSDPITKFKTVTITQLIDHITAAFPPEPEEITAVQATLREEWDPTNHIENLFQSVKEGTETLYQMKYINKAQGDTQFIKYVYVAIRNSGQFEEACIKWKALPSGDRKTNKQCRAFFSKKYNVYHTWQNSLALALAGVANSDQQVQELEQATRNGFLTMSEQQQEQAAVNTRQDAINASVLQMVAARSDGVDDNATAFSALTASSVGKDKRIKELEALLQSSDITAASTTTGTSGGRGAFPWRGSGGAGRGGGGRGAGNNGGRGRGVYRSRADGPGNITKNSKCWTAETYCWSHGYDCSSNHCSGKCTRKAIGHKDTATGGNPMGGSTKDKEFSKCA